MIKYGLSALYKMLGSALTAQYTLRAQGMPFRTPNAPPSAPRYWHDPTDAKHLNRMQAAELRRVRRAEKLERNTMSSSYHNPCLNGRIGNLNPFYVAK